MSALAMAFLEISAIAVLVKLHGCVTELLILVIWVFFPVLGLANYVYQMMLTNKLGCEAKVDARISTNVHYGESPQ